MACCTRFCLLSVLMLTSWAVHILAVLLAVAVFYDEREKMEDPPSMEMIIEDLPNVERLPINERTLTAAHLMAIGAVGFLANSVALVGLCVKQRVFLIPTFLYLFSWICLDFTNICSHFLYDGLNVELDSRTSPLIALKLVDIELATSRGFNFYFTLFRILFTLIFIRLVMTMYQRDVRMRSSRSPCRKQKKGYEQFDEKEETGKNPFDEDSKPIKILKMVCCTQFGLLFVLIVFCSVMHVFPLGLAVITFLDERKAMMKQLPELQTLLDERKMMKQLPELQTLLIPDNERTLTAAYLLVLGSIGMLLNNLAVVGLWLKRRVFLVPVSFYLCIWLSLDFFTMFCHFSFILGFNLYLTLF